MLINILSEIAALLALSVFNIIALKKLPAAPRFLKCGKGRACESIAVSAVQYIPMVLLNFVFGLIGGSHSNYFALLITAPLVLLAFFKYIGVDGLKYLDIITPAYPLALVFSKIGCFFAGCCNGIEAEYGFYSMERNIIEAPVQLIEAFNALLIFLFFMCYRKFAKKGSVYPIYVILYSSTRFFSEFLRAEKDVLWIFKVYHILCFIGIILGAAELILVSRNRKKK